MELKPVDREVLMPFTAASLPFSSFNATSEDLRPEFCVLCKYNNSRLSNLKRAKHVLVVVVVVVMMIALLTRADVGQLIGCAAAPVMRHSSAVASCWLRL